MMMKSAVAMTPKMFTSASATCSTAFCAANAGAAATTGTAAAALRTVCATFGALNAAYNTNHHDTKTVSQSIHSRRPAPPGAARPAPFPSRMGTHGES